MENSRNLILAIALMLALMFGWDWAMNQFYPQPEEAMVADKVDTPAENAALSASEDRAPARHSRTGGLVDPAEMAQERADLATALASPDRVAIDSPRLAGSIDLRGAKIDDLVLKDYDESVDGDEPVRLFSPNGTPMQHFAQFGWVGSNIAVPGLDTVWEAEGDVLAQGRPVVLSHDNGAGLRFEIRYSIDDDYMITVEQSVANTGGNAVVVQPFGVINRTSRTASEDIWIAHSGPIGVFGDAADYSVDYDDIDESNRISPEGNASWIGFTDIYWLSALVPQTGASTDTTFRAMGGEAYRAEMLYEPISVASGRRVTAESQLFAGAKDSEILDSYEDAGIAKFGLAIDWGWFRWFEKPMLWLLRALFDLVGNFGVAIIFLTVIVRGVMFPIAQKQFASMAAMKAIQPKMKALQEKHKDDRMKQQQEMQKLFKEEKVNPLAGCLPLLLQIPIFFALYKVLTLAIEMRHRDFLWIEDLSAPDPANLANALSLVGIDVPAWLMIVFGIGVLAVLLGFTMWLTFKLNPSSMDPMQQQIFNIMPWILMFVMAGFASGLLLYWVTSNILTLAQQKFLYSRHPQLKAAADKERADKAAAAAKTEG